MASFWTVSMARGFLAGMKPAAASAGLMVTATAATLAATSPVLSKNSTDCEHEKLKQHYKKRSDSMVKLKTRVRLFL